MKLYLMRHGEAASPQIDPERGLTSAGRAGIERVARQLAERGITAKQIYHSEKARARQTAEIMAQAIAPEVTLRQHNHIKPDDDPAILLNELADWQEDTLIASHLPYVPSLLIQLIESTSGINFEPGTVVCLNKQKDSGWELEWVTSPSQAI